MPRNVILHNGYLSRKKDISASFLPESGYYKVVAFEKAPRNSQGTAIHVSTETRAHINRLSQEYKKQHGRKLTHDEVVWRLIVPSELAEVDICDL